MSLIHVVFSPSTAGSLRQGLIKGSLPGEIFCVMDEPGIGPLGNGIERMKFWRNLRYSEPGDIVSNDDMYDSWRILQQQCTQYEINKIILWLGGTGSDYVFERMACFWLKDIEVPLFNISVAPVNGYYSTAVHTPESLVSFFPAAALITNEERKILSGEFEIIAANPAPLRELDAQGHLQFRDISVYDYLVLSHVHDKWQRAARIIGNSIADADPRNPLGDAFLISRLEYLIEQGLIETDGPHISLRSFRARKKR